MLNVLPHNISTKLVHETSDGGGIRRVLSGTGGREAPADPLQIAPRVVGLDDRVLFQETGEGNPPRFDHERRVMPHPHHTAHGMGERERRLTT